MGVSGLEGYFYEKCYQMIPEIEYQQGVEAIEIQVEEFRQEMAWWSIIG